MPEDRTQVDVELLLVELLGIGDYGHGRLLIRVGAAR